MPDMGNERKAVKLVNRRRIHNRALAIAVLFVVAARPSNAGQQPASIQTKELSVTAGLQRGSYEIRAQGLKNAVLQSGLAAEIDHRWLESADFPHYKSVHSTFSDSLGKGKMLTTTYWGLLNAPSLVSTIRLYDELPFGDIELKVQNSTNKLITVQAIRCIEATGSPRIDLGGREDAARVLSDTFSENEMKIYDLADAPQGVHLAVGSQLIYNRDTGQSVFFGALTSRRFPVLFGLRVAGSSSGSPRVVSYTAESTGTSEITKQEDERFGRPPAKSLVELSLPVAPEHELDSERLMFAVGPDYHAQLESYGQAVRRLHGARVNGDSMMGWWSWTDYYMGISEGTALTNAQWLADHLKKLGYNYLFIDEGYQYARGEYATANANQFPHGLRPVGRDVNHLGLKFGVWTAPFQVSERAWVCQHHKDWLVHDAKGEPIQTSTEPERLFVLDTTNPGAQAYLRRTYRTLTREWGACYIKLDFMDDTAVEGYYYRPNTTAYEAQRIGLETIRAAVGEHVLLDKDGSPMLNPVGIVDEGRISEDTAHIFSASQRTAAGIAARYYMNRNFFVTDPDAFVVSPQLVIPDQARNQTKTPLTLDEAEASIVVAAVSGGMFEIGDDLPTLGAYPERLALVENEDLIHMSQLGRAAVPLDLMTYRVEDEQPCVFLLREDRRQSMLAVFNWTDAQRSHSFRWSDLNLPEGHRFDVSDVLHHDNSVAISNESLELRNQPPHSVRLIKIIDTAIPAEPPSLTVHVLSSAEVAKPITASVDCGPDGVPALSYHWDFGDGTSGEGPQAVHTYTKAGEYALKVTAEGADGIAANKTVAISVTGGVNTQFNLKKNKRYIEPAGQ